MPGNPQGLISRIATRHARKCSTEQARLHRITAELEHVAERHRRTGWDDLSYLGTSPRTHHAVAVNLN